MRGRAFQEPPVIFYPPIFTDAKKNKSVYCSLDCKIEFTLSKPGIAQGNIARKRFTPELDLLKKGIVNFGCAFRFRIFVERPFEYCIARENGEDFIPAQGNR